MFRFQRVPQALRMPHICPWKNGFTCHVRSPPPDNGKWAGDLEFLIFRKLKLLQTKFVIEKTWGDANSDVTRLRLTTRWVPLRFSVLSILEHSRAPISNSFRPFARSRPAGKSMNSATATRSLPTFIIIDPAIARLLEIRFSSGMTQRSRKLLPTFFWKKSVFLKKYCRTLIWNMEDQSVVLTHSFARRGNLFTRNIILRGWKWCFTCFYVILGGI